MKKKTGLKNTGLVMKIQFLRQLLALAFVFKFSSAQVFSFYTSLSRLFTNLHCNKVWNRGWPPLEQHYMLLLPSSSSLHLLSLWHDERMVECVSTFNNLALIGSLTHDMR